MVGTKIAYVARLHKLQVWYSSVVCGALGVWLVLPFFVLSAMHKKLGICPPVFPRGMPAFEPRLLLSTYVVDTNLVWKIQVDSAGWTLYAHQNVTVQYVQLSDTAQLAQDAYTVNATA